MSEFISRRAERQFSDSERPSWPPADTISRGREQRAAGSGQPRATERQREYQMGERMKPMQQG